MIPLVLLFLALFYFNAVVTPLSNEGIALLTFKQSISSDPGGSLGNWNASDDTPCSWNGITCKDLKVVSVSIPKKKLSGFLPSALGFLPDLRHLNLRANEFSGGLPLELFQARGLQSLVLSGNSLSGSLPIDLGNLSYLQTLDFSDNLFNGSIPMSILQLKRLKTLDFSHNNLTGSIPDGFGAKLGSLEKLDFSFNNLNGSIPSDVGNLSSLQGTVDFSHNLFTGSIPSSLGNLPEKVYIDLSYNNLTGPIPQTGALMNRGPTAFIGNPNLCGPPLKDPCSGAAASPSSYPYLPNNASSDRNTKKSKGLSTSTVIAIVVSDVIGICLLGLLFSYCYSRVCGCGSKKDDDYGLDKGRKGRNECFCFRKDESETLSENVEQYDLVALDSQVAFDLDELLKASAFVLGKSGIGIVYKVVLEDGVTLAVRRLGEGGSQRFKEFQTEVEAIGKLKHLNIVRLRAYYWSVEEKLLIYDYIPNGSLATALHGKAGTESFTPLSWSERLRIMQGVAKGLVYLHEFSPKKYVHGDLKPNNILLDHNTEPRISDFGLGRLANITGGSPTVHSNRIAAEKHPKSTTSEMSTIGSMATSGSFYQAPEALKTMKPSQKWDIYSFGVVLLEMITGRYPVVQVGSLEMSLVDWIQVCIEEKKPLSDVLDPYLAADSDKEEEMVSVLKIAIACAHGSPERRPTMRHVSEALERLGGSSE